MKEVYYTLKRIASSSNNDEDVGVLLAEPSVYRGATVYKARRSKQRPYVNVRFDRVLGIHIRPLLPSVREGGLRYHSRAIYCTDS